MKTMRKSTCVHCVQVVRFIGHIGRARWRPGWSCDLDEWDPAIGCRKGQCYYYRRENEEKEAPNGKQA